MKYAVGTISGASLLLLQQSAWAHHGHVHEVSQGTLVGVLAGLMTIGVIAALAVARFGFGERREKRAVYHKEAQGSLDRKARANREER